MVSNFADFKTDKGEYVSCVLINTRCVRLCIQVVKSHFFKMKWDIRIAGSIKKEETRGHYTAGVYTQLAAWHHLYMWKPFHYFFAPFRRHWGIQTTIMDTFVTLFFPSTTKLLIVSFALLMGRKNLHVCLENCTHIACTMIQVSNTLARNTCRMY